MKLFAFPIALLIQLILCRFALAQINGVTVQGATETIYYKTLSGTLRGAVLLKITNNTAGPLAGDVYITAGGETVQTPVTIPPGASDLEAWAKVVWPRPKDTNASVKIKVGAQETVLSNITIGEHRPWTVHFAMDKHLDYMWQFPNEAETLAAMVKLTKIYLDAIETDKAAATSPHDEQTHFNFDQTAWWGAWMAGFPGQIQRLKNAENSKHLGVGALNLVLLTSCLGTEEMIRSMYPARQLQRDFNINIQAAVPMETGSVPWGMATVMANSEILYSIKGICNCANQPAAGNILPAALFRWKGPDGKSVVMRWDNNFSNSGFFGGYAEIFRIWADGSDTQDITNAQMDDILLTFTHYEFKNPAYPVDQILLYGLGGDFWNIGPERITKMIRAWNAQIAAKGYEYPKLKNSRAVEFFEEMESSLQSTGNVLPEFSGCFGADWDVWMLYHAKTYQIARRAREKLVAAETMAACAALLDPAGADNTIQVVRDAYDKLLKIVEHSAGSQQLWGSSMDAGPMAQFKKDAATGATAIADNLQATSLATIGSNIRTGDDSAGELLAVFNPTQYRGDFVINVNITNPGSYLIKDIAAEESVPAQTIGEISAPILRFVAKDVPGVGYKVFRIAPTVPSGAMPVAVNATNATIENQYYKITVSLASGAISSIKDKTRGGRELVDPSGDVPGVNAIRVKGGRPTLAVATAQDVGEVSGSLEIRSTVLGHSCTTTITLYNNIDRIDIKNDVTRPNFSDPEDEVIFDFPWKLASVQHRYEAGAAITRPGYSTQIPPGDHLPGSVQCYYSVQHWFDTNGRDEMGQAGGVRVATPDSYMASLGKTTIWNGPDVASPRVNFIAYDNNPPNGNIGLGDQDQETALTWQFHIQSYLGEFSGPAATRFSYPLTREPVAFPLLSNQAGALPADQHSFVNITDDRMLMSTLKIAEEGLSQGVLLRLWNCDFDGASSLASMGSFSPDVVADADLLERNLTDPAASGGSMFITIPPRGFITKRVIPKTNDDSPVAVALGPVQVAPGEIVILDGSTSTAAGGAWTARWVQLSGKHVQLSGAGTSVAQFTAPAISNVQEGALSFQLVVDDGDHLPSTNIINITVAAGISPPTAPAVMNATASGQTVQIDWSPAHDAGSGIASYKLYRAIGAGVFSVHATLGNITNYLDNNLMPGQIYQYKVTAINGAMVEGPPSPVAFAMTGDDAPPAPGSLTATGGVANVLLTWQAALPPDVAGYRVFRSSNSGAGFQQIADVGPDLLFNDPNVINGIAYYYKIAAYDATQQGAFTPEVSATPQAAPIDAPAMLFAVPGSQHVYLVWTASTSSDLAGYRIYRRTGSAGPFAWIAQTGIVNSFTDYTAANGNSYQYTVRSIANDQESSDSPVAAANPSGTAEITHKISVNSDDATSVSGVVHLGGYSSGDPVDYVSNDSESESAGMLFTLAIPGNVIINSAEIVVTAGAFQNPDATGGMSIYLYDVANVPPFVDLQATDLFLYQPVLNSPVAWPGGVDWTPGSAHTTPSIATLVQHAVNRPDWLPGNRIGFVVTEGTLAQNKYYGWIDSAAGNGRAPELKVTWTDPAPTAPTLTISSLQIGQTGNATISGAAPGDFFDLLYALAPGVTGLEPYGNLLLELNSLREVAIGVVDGSGSASIPLQVPNDPAFSGITIYLQAITAHTSPSIDANLSNFVYTILLP